MERIYDIFEKLPDGQLIWRGSVQGQETALAEVQRRAAKSPNGFQAMHLATGEVIATLPPESVTIETEADAVEHDVFRPD